MFFFLRLVARAKELNNLQLPIAQLVKNLPAMRETWVQSLGWEDPLEKGKATHSSILAWRIPWNSPWSRRESDPTEPLSLHFPRASHPVLCCASMLSSSLVNKRFLDLPKPLLGKDIIMLGKMQVFR